jgi:hypothetical protein
MDVARPDTRDVGRIGLNYRLLSFRNNRRYVAGVEPYIQNPVTRLRPNSVTHERATEIIPTHESVTELVEEGTIENRPVSSVRGGRFGARFCSKDCILSAKGYRVQ